MQNEIQASSITTSANQDVIVELNLDSKIITKIDSSLAHVRIKNHIVTEFLDDFDILDIFISEIEAQDLRTEYEKKYGFTPFVKPQEILIDARDGEQYTKNLPGYIYFDKHDLNTAIANKKLQITIDNSLSGEL